MTDIPEDILKVASAIVHDSSRYDSVGDFFRDGMVNDIAHAIFVERQACEKIARDRVDLHMACAKSTVTINPVVSMVEAYTIEILIAKRSS